MLTVQVAKIKFLNPLHSFHNNVDIVFEVSLKLPQRNLSCQNQVSGQQ